MHKLRKSLMAAAAGLIALAAATAPAQAGADLTARQSWAVLYASVVGVSYYAQSLPENYDFARTLTAVLTQESSLCYHKRGIDKSAYGCGQLQKRTAKLMNGKPVAAKKLQHDDALNIRLAARYLAFCMEKMPSWDRSVICYNKGPYRARSMSDEDVADDDYLDSVRHHMREAKNLLATVDD